MFFPDQQQLEIFHWYKWDSACFFQCLHHHWSQLWSSLGISSFHDNTSQEGLRPWMSGISLHQQTQRKGRQSCCPVSVKEDTFLSTDQDSQYNYLRIHWFLRLPKMLWIWLSEIPTRMKMIHIICTILFFQSTCSLMACTGVVIQLIWAIKHRSRE